MLCPLSNSRFVPIASLWCMPVTSGLPQTPDILGAGRHVSKVPEANSRMVFRNRA